MNITDTPSVATTPSAVEVPPLRMKSQARPALPEEGNPRRADDTISWAGFPAGADRRHVRLTVRDRDLR